MAITTYLMQNQTVTEVTTASPALTISGDTSNISYDMQVACPTDSADSLSIEVQRSTDGGSTWDTISEMDCQGGTVKKGPNQGQPYTLESGGSVWPVNDGDQIQAAVTAVNGGTWICTVTITQA